MEVKLIANVRKVMTTEENTECTNSFGFKIRKRKSITYYGLDY